MQCPICSSVIPDDAVVCDKCGAARVTQRTPLGVIVGWAGVTMATIWGILWLFLISLLVVGWNVSGYPWVALIAGTFVTAGLFWYSKSTRHAEWKRRED